MRMRAKALTVAAAMVTTFAILPTFGAAAAEPLEDGSYAVTVGESTWTVDVVAGVPSVGAGDDAEFSFAFDEETGRVLDEFDVSIDGVAYDVEVEDDGTVEVTPQPSEDGTEADDDGDDAEGGDAEGGDDEGEGEGDDEGDDEGADEEGDDALELLEEDEDGEDAEEEDGSHGELVSTVAQCAPSGKVAREAGLPNHGFFVRAAAHGESVDFEVDGETMTADLSSLEGAEAFCTLAEELVAPAAGEDATAAEDDAASDEEAEESTLEDAEASEDGDEARGNGRGKGKGRSGDAPGRSGDAPGRAGKGA